MVRSLRSISSLVIGGGVNVVYSIQSFPRFVFFCILQGKLSFFTRVGLNDPPPFSCTSFLHFVRMGKP
jgi:hypothetical protein